MILKVYAIYDSKVVAYMQPFFMQANGAAIRAFTDIVNDKSSMIGKYPADYTLFAIGTYDDSSGKLESYLTPLSLGVGSEFIQS